MLMVNEWYQTIQYYPCQPDFLRAAPIEERYFCSKQIIPLSPLFTHADVLLNSREQNVMRVFFGEICNLSFMGLGTPLPALFAKL